MNCGNCGWFRPDSNPNILFGHCDGINTNEPEDKSRELIHAFSDDSFVAVIITVHKSFGCKNYEEKK